MDREFFSPSELGIARAGALHPDDLPHPPLDHIGVPRASSLLPLPVETQTTLYRCV